MTTTTASSIGASGGAGNSQSNQDPDQNQQSSQDPQPSSDPNGTTQAQIIGPLPGLEIFDAGVLITSTQSQTAHDDTPQTAVSTAPVAYPEDDCLSPLRKEDTPFTPDRSWQGDLPNDTNSPSAPIVEHLVSGPAPPSPWNDAMLAGLDPSPSGQGHVAPHFDDQNLSPYDSRSGSSQADRSHEPVHKNDSVTAQRQGELTEIVRTFTGRKQQPDDSKYDNEPGIFEALKFDRWHSYKVKRGDTLLSIATKELGNPHLVPLLIQLNRGLLTFDKEGNAKLKPGMTLRLPSRSEVIRFLAQSEQEKQLQISFGENPAEIQLPYVCRLGDTLKTIAKRHPAVRDARLWPLIARVNNLDQSAGEDGQPLAKIRRGQKIILPSLEERKQFLLEWTFGEDPIIEEQRRISRQSARKTAGSDEPAISSEKLTNRQERR